MGAKCVKKNHSQERNEINEDKRSTTIKERKESYKKKSLNLNINENDQITKFKTHEKEWWELKECDEIIEKLSSYSLNNMLRKGEKLSLIIETMFFEDNNQLLELIIGMLEKIIEEERKILNCPYPEILSELTNIISVVKSEFYPNIMEFLSNINNRIYLKYNELVANLEFLVDFYQIILFYKVPNPFPQKTKWWEEAKEYSSVKSYLLKFQELLTFIKEKSEISRREDEKIENKSKIKAITNINNINLEQEFNKKQYCIGKNDFLWNQSDLEFETISELHLFPNDDSFSMKGKGDYRI